MSRELRLRAEGLTWQSVEGELVALDVLDSVYLAANHTGALLWTTLAKGATREELVSLLTESFEVSTATATADVDRFLAQLRDRGLLED